MKQALAIFLVGVCVILAFALLIGMIALPFVVVGWLLVFIVTYAAQIATIIVALGVVIVTMKLISR
ncbi:MAG: hypothetical protein JKP96_09715 [Oceanicaulis sp.]|jgi:hypothetical protein|nr:hypothetical protein [Oceanicaulis sp.]